MSEYRVTVPVKKANGYQSYLVDAESVDDAVEKWRAGKARFECEELEITSLDGDNVEAVEA